MEKAMLCGPSDGEGDVVRTQRIARVRIHVKRAIGQIKNFAIFDGVLPLTLIGSANQKLDNLLYACELPASSSRQHFIPPLD